jgi:hypothetical protein
MDEIRSPTHIIRILKFCFLILYRLWAQAANNSELLKNIYTNAVFLYVKTGVKTTEQRFKGKVMTQYFLCDSRQFNSCFLQVFHDSLLQ